MTDTSVRYPEMRSRLRGAAAAFVDSELQERLWLKGERKSAEEWNFEDAMLYVIDQLAVGHAEELVGLVLANDAELEAFRVLSSAMESLASAIGEEGTYADAMSAGPLWEDTVSAARILAELLDDR